MIGILLAFHLLSAVIWVGGMFFAYMIVRPAAGNVLEAPERLRLWSKIFKSFLPRAWISAALLFSTGAVLLSVYSLKGAHVIIMSALAVAMLLILGHVTFAPAKRLHKFVAEANFEEAAAQLDQIRKLIGINTLIGLVIIVIASAGKFWF